jgi:hypothetical protein
MKIYVVPAEEKERPDETQLTTKIIGFLSFTLVKCYCTFWQVSHPMYDQTQDSFGAVFSLLYG